MLLSRVLYFLETVSKIDSSLNMDKRVVCVITGDRFSVGVICSLAVRYFCKTSLHNLTQFSFVVIIRVFFCLKVHPLRHPMSLPHVRPVEKYAAVLRIVSFTNAVFQAMIISY